MKFISQIKEHACYYKDIIKRIQQNCENERGWTKHCEMFPHHQSNLLSAIQ